MRPDSIRVSRQAETRAKILGAAREHFDLHGYELTGIRNIANLAGLSTGSVFSNWSGKEALYAEIYGHPPVDADVGRELLLVVEDLVAALASEASALVGPQHNGLRNRVWAAIRAARPGPSARSAEAA